MTKVAVLEVVNKYDSKHNAHGNTTVKKTYYHSNIYSVINTIVDGCYTDSSSNLNGIRNNRSKNIHDSIYSNYN